MARLHVFGDSHAIAYEGGERGVEPERRSRFAGVEVHHLGRPWPSTWPGTTRATPGKWGLAIEDCDSPAGRGPGGGAAGVRRDRPPGPLSQALPWPSRCRCGRRSRPSPDATTPLPSVWPTGPGCRFSAPARWPRPRIFSNQYPLIGSEVERNYATCVYNELLSDWCADTPGVYFFSAHTRLMTPDLETRSEYFGDGCHLNHRGIDLVIEAFKRTVEANGLDLPDFSARARISCGPRSRLWTSRPGAGCWRSAPPTTRPR